MRALFVPDNDGITEILTSEDAMALCLSVVEAGAAVARDLMPKGETGYEQKAVVSGAAQVVDGVASAQFGSVSETWHMTEFGSIHNPPYAPLRNAAQSLNIEFRPE